MAALCLRFSASLCLLLGLPTHAVQARASIDDGSGTPEAMSLLQVTVDWKNPKRNRSGHAQSPDEEDVVHRVKGELKKVNETMDKIAEALDSANNTLKDTLDLASGSIGSFVTALQTAKEVSASPLTMGVEDAAEKITSLCDRAMKSASEIQSKVQESADTDTAKLDGFFAYLIDLDWIGVAPQTALLDQLFSNFDKALADTKACVGDNSSESLLHVKKSQTSEEFWPFSKQRGCAGVCACAAESIATANGTLGSIVLAIDDIKAQVNETLYSSVEHATSPVDEYITQVEKSIKAAGLLPAPLLTPIETAVGQLKNIKDYCGDSLSDRLPEVFDTLEDAKANFEAVHPLMDQLLQKVNVAE